MAKSTGGSRKLLWLMGIVVILSSSAAAAALYMVFDQRNDGAQAQSQIQEEVVAERVAPIFVTIEPFTVNLADDQYGTRLLYAGMTLKVADQHTREVLTEHMPQVRSRLLMLFSGQQARELTGPEGKRTLAEEVLATLDAPMTENQPELAIDDVLFTEFIVQ
ncbi:flagellar basal body-associated protein FliL [Halomonas urumqiensis]|uniref:Flagellar protein FliL n=1 Tax=Halomonas urumqiensis TaxID=1684789 RepID=A0A2N7UNV5_9GAMM|nr:flagellar basal body-associated protein FliL [Halomonas urumqiensis]PMR82082.1 flagellar basal body-associated protein FliL [Halomonas urumqiensis]PTB02586.1 flagellar basal body-associated protein FliL [Halomonas urumqiensis]GHE21067.1 flagellar basal body-associated protein FliL [Halomonas urumqiensis]